MGILRLDSSYFTYYIISRYFFFAECFYGDFYAVSQSAGCYYYTIFREAFLYAFSNTAVLNSIGYHRVTYKKNNGSKEEVYDEVGHISLPS